MNQTTKVVSAFLGVFAAGAVSGGLFTYGAARRHLEAEAATARPAVMTVQAPLAQTPQPRGTARRNPPQARVYSAVMSQYTQRLNLTAEQRALIAPHMAQAEEALQTLRRENLENTTSVMNRMYSDISRNLTPEQLAELEQMKRTFEERMAEENKKAREEGVPKNETPASGKKTEAGRPPS